MQPLITEVAFVQLQQKQAANSGVKANTYHVGSVITTFVNHSVYQAVNMKAASKIEQSKEIIRLVSQKTNRAILFYSTGKDSIVTLDLMHPYFEEIVCVFMYFVRDLDHINKYLNWAHTKYPNVTIVQCPHWNLTYLLRSGVFCVPNPNVKVFKVAKVDEAMRLKHNINFSFYGMKKADSMNRRLMLNTYENAISNTNKVYPLADWTNKEVLAYMKAHKLPEPVRYSTNASGGVGFNIECYLWMRHNATADLAKVLKTFPMSEKLLYDFDTFKAQKQRELKQPLTDECALKLYKQR